MKILMLEKQQFLVFLKFMKSLQTMKRLKTWFNFYKSWSLNNQMD